MAQKRMLSQAVTETDKFYMLPPQSQALYLHLSVMADDDGFVDKARMIARNCGASINDIDELVNKKFLIRFEEGIYCLTHWRINNNKIKDDRYKGTLYKEYYKRLIDEQGNAYILKSGGITEASRNQSGTGDASENGKIGDMVETSRNHIGGIAEAQSRVEKIREDKSRAEQPTTLPAANNSHSNSPDIPEETIRSVLTRNKNDVNNFVIELINSGLKPSSETMNLIHKVSGELKSEFKAKNVINLDKVIGKSD